MWCSNNNRTKRQGVPISAPTEDFFGDWTGACVHVCVCVCVHVCVCVCAFMCVCVCRLQYHSTDATRTYNLKLTNNLYHHKQQVGLGGMAEGGGGRAGKKKNEGMGDYDMKQKKKAKNAAHLCMWQVCNVGKLLQSLIDTWAKIKRGKFRQWLCVTLSHTTYKNTVIILKAKALKSELPMIF